MTWRAEWTGETQTDETSAMGNWAEGDSYRVLSSDPDVQSTAEETLRKGWVDLTPTGPRLDVPHEMATWAAFCTALNEVTARRGETLAGRLSVINPPPPVDVPDRGGGRLNTVH